MYDVPKNSDVFLDSYEIWVMRQFDDNGNMAVGRTKLAEIAKEAQIDIGEGKIRKILIDLKNKNLLVDEGKKGSRITDLGKATIDKHRP